MSPDLVPRMRRHLAAAARTGILTLAAVFAATPSLACPANAELTARDLHGTWRADIDGTWLSADLVLQSNPDWPASLAGRIRRDGRESLLAGDLEDGTFTLEESSDGVRIDATWVGKPVEGRCGREIRGIWRASGHESGREFMLLRPPARTRD